MKHEHYEVLLAIAEGKEVEYKYCGVWSSPTRNDMNPIDNTDLDWRVKPDMDDVIRDAHSKCCDQISAGGTSLDIFKAGFQSGVLACQNGEYY